MNNVEIESRLSRLEQRYAMVVGTGIAFAALVIGLLIAQATGCYYQAKSYGKIIEIQQIHEDAIRRVIP